MDELKLRQILFSIKENGVKIERTISRLNKTIKSKGLSSKLKKIDKNIRLINEKR